MKCTNCFLLIDDQRDEEKVNKVGRKGDWVWRNVKAVIDSGAVDHVANPDVFPGIKVVETEESRRGDLRLAAGGSPIEKMGEMYIPWLTENSILQTIRMKAGRVGQTLLSTEKLNKEGWSIILSEDESFMFNKKDRIKIMIHTAEGALSHVNMWVNIWKERQ